MIVEVREGVWVNLDNVFAVQLEGRKVAFMDEEGHAVRSKDFDTPEDAKKWFEGLVKQLTSPAEKKSSRKKSN